MDISEKKIHCSSCSKNLVDFRGKTPNQIKEERKTFTQTPCGVFTKNQVETKSYIIPRFAFSQKYVAAVFLAVGLFPTWAKGQIEPKVDSTQLEVLPSYFTTILEYFKGQIIDQNNKPIQGVINVYQNDSLISQTSSNELGYFTFLSPIKGEVQLEIIQKEQNEKAKLISIRKKLINSNELVINITLKKHIEPIEVVCSGTSRERKSTLPSFNYFSWSGRVFNRGDELFDNVPNRFKQ
jgi:hypothetical protein